MIEINKVYTEDCLETMSRMPDNFIDLVVTSPPYSNLRDYTTFFWDFESIAKELYRILKPGGTLVWVVGDKTSKGTEELTPFRHAIYFQDIVGFNTWDTMIYVRQSPFPANVRYNQNFEFMFVFSKGKPKTFNPLKEPKTEKEIEKIKNKTINVSAKSYRNKDGSITKAASDERILKRLENSKNNLEKTRSNVWYIPAGYRISAKQVIAHKHPAIFPEQLVNDHILSWSDEKNLVYDCFAGSGTTGIVAKRLNRNFILSEISSEYCDIIKERFNLEFGEEL